MTTYEIIEDIAAPIDAVWAVLEDVEKWPEWATSIESLNRAGSGPIGVGSEVTIRQAQLGESVWKVTAWNPPHSFQWETKRSGVTVSASHKLEAVPNGARVTLGVEFLGAFAAMVAVMARETIEKHLAQEAVGLKKRCEGA